MGDPTRVRNLPYNAGTSVKNGVGISVEETGNMIIANVISSSYSRVYTTRNVKNTTLGAAHIAIQATYIATVEMTRQCMEFMRRSICRTL